MTLTDLYRLDGRTAIITGASRGIGRGISKRFAQAGANVVLAARTTALLDALRDEIEAAGGHAIAVPTDVGVDGELHRLVDAANDAYGGVDILVNNAAAPRYALAQPAHDMKLENFDLTLDITVRSAFLLSQLVARDIMARRERGAPNAGGASNATGAIVNITSIAGWIGVGNYAAYSAAKAALMRLSESLAIDWGPHGIRVNCVGPGFVATDENRHIWEDPASHDRVKSTIPLNKTGLPLDIANAALFLASDAASFITGQTLYVDGGSGPIRPGSALAANIDTAATGSGNS